MHCFWNAEMMQRCPAGRHLHRAVPALCGDLPGTLGLAAFPAVALAPNPWNPPGPIRSQSGKADAQR